MLLLTRLNGTHFYVNAELIQTIEETPNTVITLLDHNRLVVLEPAEVVVERYMQYRQKINQPPRVEGTRLSS